MSYLATRNFFEDKDFVDKWLYTMRTGELDLSWMKAGTESKAACGESPAGTHLSRYQPGQLRRRCDTGKSAW